MNSIRGILTGVVVLALTGGYLGSQWAYLNGQAADWAQRMNQPTIALLAMVLFVAMLAMAAFRDSEAESGDR